LELAGIEEGEFHDLRRTNLTNLLAGGMSEFDVMKLAGHAEFETTHRSYLAIRDDVLNKARAIIQKLDFIAIPLQVPFDGEVKKSCRSQVIGS
jgi:integrase